MRTHWLYGMGRFLGSLSFGGMFGGGLAGLVHVLWLSASGVPFVQFVFSGMLIGSALHRPIALGWEHFFGPLAEHGTTLIQIRKLRYYADRGLIRPEKLEELFTGIVEDDIRGGRRRDRLLPR
jgi:hypothetical protein